MSNTKTIELKGHLIDSLTLAKVIDVIQAEPDTSYKVDFMDVGYAKRDFSIAQLRITTNDERDLSHLLDNLKTYGATEITHNESQTEACSVDATPPPRAIFVESLHQRIMIDGEWVPIAQAETNNHADAHVFRYDPVARTATITRVSQLKAGDDVVTLHPDAQVAAYNLLK